MLWKGQRRVGSGPLYRLFQADIISLTFFPFLCGLTSVLSNQLLNKARKPSNISPGGPGTAGRCHQSHLFSRVHKAGSHSLSSKVQIHQPWSCWWLPLNSLLFSSIRECKTGSNILHMVSRSKGWKPFLLVNRLWSCIIHSRMTSCCQNCCWLLLSSLPARASGLFLHELHKGKALPARIVPAVHCKGHFHEQWFFLCKEFDLTEFHHTDSFLCHFYVPMHDSSALHHKGSSCLQACCHTL